MSGLNNKHFIYHRSAGWEALDQGTGRERHGEKRETGRDRDTKTRKKRDSGEMGRERRGRERHRESSWAFNPISQVQPGPLPRPQPGGCPSYIHIGKLRPRAANLHVGPEDGVQGGPQRLRRRNRRACAAPWVLEPGLFCRKNPTSWMGNVTLGFTGT